MDTNLENEQGYPAEDERSTINHLEKEIERQKAEAEAIIHQHTKKLTIFDNRLKSS